MSLTKLSKSHIKLPVHNTHCTLLGSTLGVSHVICMYLYYHLVNGMHKML